MKAQKEKCSLGIKDVIIHFVNDHAEDIVVVRVHCHNEEQTRFISNNEKKTMQTTANYIHKYCGEQEIFKGWLEYAYIEIGDDDFVDYNIEYEDLEFNENMN